MTTNNAPGLSLDSGEFVPAAELGAPRNATTSTLELPPVGSLWAHTGGAIYVVMHIANADSQDDVRYPKTVVYRGVSNGRVWSRLATDWHRSMTLTSTPEIAGGDRGDLYWRLHSLSKSLEGGGRIDEHEHPDAYRTILDAMRFTAKKGGA